MKMNSLLNKIPIGIYFVLALFVLTSYTFAANYYVRSDGNNNNDGSADDAAHAWLTLAKAASTVPDGANHTIHVAPGSYAGFTDSRNGQSPGYRYWVASGTVTITSTVQLDGKWIKLDGFKITGANPLIMTWTSSDHCVIQNIEAYSPRGDVIMDIRGTNHQILDNDLHDPGTDFFHVFDSGHTFRGNYLHNWIRNGDQHADAWQTWNNGSYGSPAHNIIIESNHVFMGNDSTGVLSGDGPSGGNHIFMWEDSGSSQKASNLIVRNNIFESTGGLNTDGGGRPDGLRVYNNLWRSDYNISTPNSAPGLRLNNANDIEIRNNLFIDGIWGVGINSCTNVANSTNLFWRYDGRSTSNTNYTSTGDRVNTNPLFSSYNKSAYNLTTAYQLQPNSPAIDAGTSVAAVTDDYAMISRPQGAAYDVGAYEKPGLMAPMALRIIK